MSSLPAPVAAMIDALDEPGARELERVLRARLYVPPAAAERRLSQLGFLAELLDTRGEPHFLGFTVVPRQLYDENRPEEATLSQKLVERFHSWLEACRAAGNLSPDGRFTDGAGRPWGQRRDETPPIYTRDDVHRAIRDCARDQGRTPTSHEYVLWCRAKRVEARRTGAGTVPPTMKTLYRFYPAGEGGWAAAVSETSDWDRFADLAGMPAEQAIQPTSDLSNISPSVRRKLNSTCLDDSIDGPVSSRSDDDVGRFPAPIHKRGNV